jgi:4-hydroxy-L-threonine phosphate dehydrogenase PdxA
MTRLAITLGDPRGIGPEIVARALEPPLDAEVTLEPDAVITSGVTFERARKKDVADLVDRIYQGIRRQP